MAADGSAVDDRGVMTRNPTVEPPLPRQRSVTVPAGARTDPALATGNVAPFALAGGASVLIAVIGLTPRHPDVFLVGIGLCALLIIAGVLSTRIRFPTWVDPIMPLAAIAVIAVLRHGAGGFETGYSTLLIIPILWLAAFATWRQLATGLVLVLLVLILPIIVIGGTEYPASEWRRAILTATIASFVGLTIQRLVQDVHARAAELAARDADLVEQADITRAMVDGATDVIVTLDEGGRIVEWNSAASVAFGRRYDELVGLDFVDRIIAPDERETIRAGFGRLVRDGATDREQRFETAFIDGTGQIVPVEVTTAVTHGRHGQRIHAFARDSSVRQRAAAAAEAHLADLDRLLTISRGLGLGTSPEDDRAAICLHAQEMAGADMALFFEARPGERALFATGRSGDGPALEGITLSGRSSMTAVVFASGQAEFVPDVFADPRIDRDLAVRLGAKSAFFQPILRSGIAVGVLVIYWRAIQGAVPGRVSSMIGIFATQAAVLIERADLLARLDGLARTDALTGVANRRALDDGLTAELDSARRTGAPLSIVMLDLDHFKAYNDGHGHQAGDRLLRDAAGRWRAELRPLDLLVRYGGEEFLVVLPGCDLPAALVTAGRLRACVPDSQTVSGGVAKWDGSESMNAFIGRADAALYAAKRGGRDRAFAAETPAPHGSAAAVAATTPASRRRHVTAAISGPPARSSGDPVS